VHIAKDITEQRKMEHLKDELLSAVSHEMRTPLTAMLGFIEFLMENEVDRDMEMDYLATVHKETEKLNELIGNFLDLQRLQAEMEIYSFEAVDVRNLLQEAAYLFAKASKKHQIAVDCPPELPPVRGDFGRLQQVLKNLISNAIKYSPQGGKITLGARREEENILFWVKDEGMGIPQEALEKIFDRFYRENESARRIPGGVGLGLTLVREIVKAHQGRVWAASKPGKGSTFYIRLPLMKKA
jgi:signal transduction histidine kinase